MRLGSSETQPRAREVRTDVAAAVWWVGELDVPSLRASIDLHASDVHDLLQTWSGRSRSHVVVVDEAACAGDLANCIDRIAKKVSPVPVVIATRRRVEPPAGAQGVIELPVGPTAVLALQALAQSSRLAQENRALRQRPGLERIVGWSAAARRMRRSIEQVKDVGGDCVLMGDAGAGKRHAAHALYDASSRRGPLVEIDCASLEPAALERALFATKPFGAITEAREGTLLLCRIEALPTELHERLLGELRSPARSECTVVVTSRVRLDERGAEGELVRGVHRILGERTISVPPLAERAEDIAALAGHFLQLHAARLQVPRPLLQEPVLDVLQRYAWPGNVRELENVISAALLQATAGVIRLGALPQTLRLMAMDEEPEGLADLAWAERVTITEARRLVQRRFERAYLQRLLAATEGNISEAARRAGIDRSNFRRIMARCGIGSE